MKRTIKVDLNKDIKEYITELKLSMISMQMENSGAFGDPDLFKKAKLFNSLDDWEKNLICLYLYTNSYKKCEEYLNVKKTTICSTIKAIKEKLYY